MIHAVLYLLGCLRMGSAKRKPRVIVSSMAVIGVRSWQIGHFQVSLSACTRIFHQSYWVQRRAANYHDAARVFSSSLSMNGQSIESQVQISMTIAIGHAPRRKSTNCALRRILAEGRVSYPCLDAWRCTGDSHDPSRTAG